MDLYRFCLPLIFSLCIFSLGHCKISLSLAKPRECWLRPLAFIRASACEAVWTYTGFAYLLFFPCVFFHWDIAKFRFLWRNRVNAGLDHWRLYGLPLVRPYGPIPVLLTSYFFLVYFFIGTLQNFAFFGETA